MQMPRLLARVAGLSTFILATCAWAQFGSGPAELELVDDKFPADYENIMRLLRTVTEQPVVYLINTHYHGDHSGSNSLLQETVREMQRAGRSAADIEAMMRSEFGWEDFHVQMSLAGLLVELQ